MATSRMPAHESSSQCMQEAVGATRHTSGEAEQLRRQHGGAGVLAVEGAEVDGFGVANVAQAM